MKKILVLCQYYYPEPVRISNICEELAKRNFEIDVVTGIPNYPMGDIYEEYKKSKKKNEIINGVNIHRCFTIPRKKGIFMRLLNYYSFAISSSIYCSKIKKEYDFVFVYQLSPIMMACGGIKYKSKKNKKMFLYCLDLWPESLKAGGMKENSLIYKFFLLISSKIYNKSDKIFISSKKFEKYLVETNKVKKRKIEYLPQYATEEFKFNECKKSDESTIDFMFAGNLGAAQSIYTIISAAEILQSNKNVFFHFVGDGSEYQNIVEYIEEHNMNNIIMHGRKPLDEMPFYYKMADAMIVTLNGNTAVSDTVPGKVQSYMAAGKPIIGAINGETKKIIEESHCGYCGEADNVEQLVNNIKKFIKSNKKTEMALNSYCYYKKYFDKEIFIDKLIKAFE